MPFPFLVICAALLVSGCNKPPERYKLQCAFVGELYPIKLFADGKEIGILRDTSEIEWSGRLRTSSDPKISQVLSAQVLRPDGWEPFDVKVHWISDRQPSSARDVSLDVPFGREPFIKLFVDNRGEPESALDIGCLHSKVAADQTATLDFLAPRSVANTTLSLNREAIGPLKLRDELLNPAEPTHPHSPCCYIVDTSGKRQYRVEIVYYGIGAPPPPPKILSNQRLYCFGEAKVVDFLTSSPSMDRIGSHVEISEVNSAEGSRDAK